ncbi:MAG: hypothetical protein ACYDD5_00930 [Sulfuricurvum sp.]
MKIVKGIYRCGIVDDLYLYFTSKRDADGWIIYIFLNESIQDPVQGEPSKRTACTLNSGRYLPENLIIPCKSYKEALALFTPEQSPELFI